VALLIASILLCRWIQTGKAGTLLLAMPRQGRPGALLRLRTSPTSASSRSGLAAALAGIGGALFSLQVGFMSPSFVGIVPSVEMVIFAASAGA